MRMLRQIALVGAGVLLLSGLTACKNVEASDNVKTLKMALEIAPNALTTQMAQKAADQIYEETNGSVVVEVYPSGQLGSQRDFIESMMLGTIEIGYVSASSVENFEPEFVLYDIPFTVFGPEHAMALWESDLSQEVQQRFLDEQGIRTLGMIDAGPRNIYTTEEVRTADDFSKLTMRVADVAGLINLFDALNANPTVTAFNEIYTANIVGIKYSFPDMPKMLRFQTIRGGDFSVLTGPDDLFYALLASGGDGTISGNSNVIPQEYVSVYSAFQRGDYQEAARRQARVNQLNAILSGICNLASYKACLVKRGVIRSKNLRAPLRPLSSEQEAELFVRLEQLGEDSILAPVQI